MKKLVLLLLLIFSYKISSQEIYYLTFENPSQTSTHFTWDVRISAVSSPFVLLASNIRYNFNNSALSTTTAPTFTVTLGGYQFDAASFLGTAPNRYVNLGFSPTGSGISITTTGAVIGTVSHPRAGGMVNGLPTDTRVRAWNVAGYTNYAPTASATNCSRIFTQDSPSTPVQAGVPANLPNILLPIYLKYFSVEKYEERSSRLTWTSTSEVNSSHFEVERSLDMKEFQKVGVVSASGSSFTEVSYEFFDKTIPTQRNSFIVYYRLKMVDLDGAYKYSDIRGVSFENKDIFEIKIFPNPVATTLNIDLNFEDFDNSVSVLQITDLGGRIVYAKKIFGKGIETVNMDMFSSGLYYITIESDSKLFQEKIIKID